MKNTFLFFILWLLQNKAVAQLVDIEITSPQANKLEIYLSPQTPSTTINLTEVTFSLKRFTSCGAAINVTTSHVSGLVFNPVVMGTVTDGSYTYDGFTALPNFPYPVLSARTKVATLSVTGSVSTCEIRIENAPFPILLNGTLNIVNNLGATVNGDILNNASSVVLPVELLSFKATKNQGKTLVEWEAVQEKNLSNYILERSEDGRNFKAIGIEKPKAKSETEKAAYNFVDDQPEIGINYYRLQSKGAKKEDFKYSKVVSVDFGLGLKAKAFPNPFAAELNIEIDIEQGVKGEVMIDMFDTAGKQVLTKKINAEGRRLNFEVPTEGLVPGSYVIRVKNGSSTWQHKITKQ
jgi:Secretion system C-terminal sorting domain